MRAGVHLSPDRIRAVRLGGWPKPRAEVYEVSWDPDEPVSGLRALAEHLGSVDRVCVSVDLPFLHVRRVALPPLSVDERQRILSLEPARFFAVEDEDLVFAVRPSDDLVLAGSAARLTAWIDRLEAVGPVESVEPAPMALARALARAGVRDGCVVLGVEGGEPAEPGGDGPRGEGIGGAAPRRGEPAGGALLVEGAPGDRTGFALLELAGGRVQGVRRLFGGAAAAREAIPAEHRNAPLYLIPWSERVAAELAGGVGVGGPQRVPLPEALRGLDASYLAAYGAALSPHGDLEARLLPRALRERIRRRARRSLTTAAIACVAASVLFLFALDDSRARAEELIEARVVQLRDQAGMALSMQADAAEVLDESRTLQQLEARRARPLVVLLEISELLPEDVHLSLIRLTADEWRIDGLADQAAALIPLLEEHPYFEQVRFLSATSRARTGDETYERFSIVFRYAPAP